MATNTGEAQISSTTGRNGQKLLVLHLPAPEPCKSRVHGGSKTYEEALAELVAIRDGLTPTLRAPQRPERKATIIIDGGEPYVQTQVEKDLEVDFWEYMEARGVVYDSQVAFGPNKIDLWHEASGTLIEVKRNVETTKIRLALGQLQDYALDVPWQHRAVLLPERPSLRMERLLHLHNVNIVWQRFGGFSDNANGRFTTGPISV